MRWMMRLVRPAELEDPGSMWTLAGRPGTHEALGVCVNGRLVPALFQSPLNAMLWKRRHGDSGKVVPASSICDVASLPAAAIVSIFYDPDNGDD